MYKIDLVLTIFMDREYYYISHLKHLDIFILYHTLLNSLICFITKQNLTVHYIKITKFSETLLRIINEFLSDNIVETIDKLSSIVNVDELKQSLAVACDLRESIEIAADTTATTVSMVNSEQLQQLKNTLSKTLALCSTNELNQVIGKEALEQLVNTSTHLSLEVAAVISQTKLETLEVKEKFTELTVESSQKNDQANIISETEKNIKHAENLSDKIERICSEGDYLQVKTMISTSTDAVEDVIATDETKIVNQLSTEVVPESMIKDSGQTVIELAAKKEDEHFLTNTVDTSAIKDTEIIKPLVESEPQLIAETVANTAIIIEDHIPYALPDASLQLSLLLGDEITIKSEAESACVSTEPFDESPEISLIKPAVQLTDDALQTPVTVIKHQVQSAPDIKQGENQEKISSDIIIVELSLVKEATTVELTSQKQEHPTERVILNQIASENVYTNVVSEEGTLLHADLVAPDEPIIRKISDTASAVTTITVIEDTVQPLGQEMPSNVTNIYKVSDEVVNTTIVTADQVVQSLILEKEQVPLIESEIASNLTKLELEVHESVESSSPIIKESNSKDIEVLVTDIEHVDVKVTEESSLDLVAKTTASEDQSFIRSTETDVLQVKTMPLEQEKPEVGALEKLTGEIIETATFDKTEKVETIQAKAIAEESSISENIEHLPATTTEESNGLGLEIAVTDITKSTIAAGKEAINFNDAEETTPLWEKVTKSEHEDQSIQQVVGTEIALVTETVEITAITDEIKCQPLEQEAAVRDTVITEQAVAVGKETTVCIDVEGSKPINQKDTKSDYLDNSVESELKVMETETQFVTENIEVTATTDLKSQLLEQEKTVSNAIVTEQPTAVGKKLNDFIDVEETTLLTQDKTASEYVDEQEPKIVETETQLIKKSVEESMAANLVDHSLEKGVTVSNAIISEQPAVGRETIECNDMQNITPLQQDENISLKLEPEVIESKLDTKSIELCAASEVVEVESSAQESIVTSLSVEKAPRKTVQPTTKIDSITMELPQQEKVIIETEQTVAENVHSIAGKVEVKQAEQNKIVIKHAPKPQDENIVLRLSKEEDAHVCEPVTEAQQAEITEDSYIHTSELSTNLILQETAKSVTKQPYEDSVPQTMETKKIALGNINKCCDASINNLFNFVELLLLYNAYYNYTV